MKFITTLLFTAALAAQPPIPSIVANTYQIGGTGAWQVGSGIQSQYAMIVTDPVTAALAAPGDPMDEFRVTQPGTAYLLTWSNALSCPIGSYLPFVAVNVYTGAVPGPIIPLGPILFPGAAAGFDRILVDPINMFLGPATVTEPFLGISGWRDMFYTPFVLPATPSVSGTVITTQWLRVDPVDGLVYLSPEHHVRVV